MMQSIRHACPGQCVNLPPVPFGHARPRTKSAKLAGSEVAKPPGAQICFDRSCQEQADALFLASTVAPVFVAIVVVSMLLQRKGMSEQDLFSFDEPERDKNGELVYRPSSYTPWPVEERASGERFRIGVGPVSELQKMTFVFDRLFSTRSKVLAVTLPRPMGIVFEEEARTGRAVVGDIIEGSAAHQRSQIAKLDGQRMAAAQKGDILRACTCTNFVYESAALFGARAPRRTIVLYGADNQRWPQVANALKRGDKADGPVTLVLERPETISPS